MNTTWSNEENDTGPLVHVREGMAVYDRDQEKVGKVDFVYLGEVSEQEANMGRGPQAVTDTELPGVDHFPVDFAFGGTTGISDPTENETLKARLKREGFVRVDGAGLFSHEHYVLSEQIASVSEDKVYLNVSRDDLLDLTS